jgi:hypothetical protein
MSVYTAKNCHESSEEMPYIQTEALMPKVHNDRLIMPKCSGRDQDSDGPIASVQIRVLHLHPFMGADKRALNSKRKTVVLARSVLPLHLIDTGSDGLLRKRVRRNREKMRDGKKPCNECAQHSSGSNQSSTSETCYLYESLVGILLLFPSCCCVGVLRH